MKISGLKTSTNVLFAVAIALTGTASPAFSQTDQPATPTTPPAETRPATPAEETRSGISPQDPLCRAANRSTPIFESASTISSALQLVPPDGFVRLVVVPPPGSQFAQINLPISGFIQTAVLKACSTPPPPPPVSCRFSRAPVPINVRREPDVDANNIIGVVNPGQRVFVTFNSNGTAVSTQADGFNWVQIDMTRTPFFRPSGLGWMVNSRVGTGESNLGYCQ
ncbi:hypothetical protein [Leptothermofonsia sp. ETS-13]|uniref:hypothetical protein n=1 Tax=Leptothermofonsia sp. ETS-13 TaxID=3035696 RepID=UPI003BA271C2